MTPAERARLAALADAATPGPWDEHEWAVVALPEVAPVCHAVHEDDAAFIAASRTAVPALLAALDDAERERDRLRAAGGTP